MDLSINEELTVVLSRLRLSQIIFWDFDGVIKDSLSVKSAAFAKIFCSYGQEVVDAVKQHHEANGGKSRFEKIPLYLKWAGEDVTEDLVEEFCSRFSGHVVQAVIDSPWVPGIPAFLKEQRSKKYFVLVTATPQDEIEKILFALNIDRCFQRVFGAPTKKQDAVQTVLEKQKLSPDCALMIGDTDADLFAATVNSVPFLLRKTSMNSQLQHRYKGPQFGNLIYG